MAKKIYLSPSSQSENAYATGNTTEQEQCRKIATACAKYLKNVGFNVINACYGTMYTRIDESNKWGADLHVPIHTNAFNGKITGGTQILLYKLNGEHKKAGQAILNRLGPITPGKSHEKLVQNTEFYEIINANAMTVYCECEFHDTKQGADFIRSHTSEIGEAIAKGICDYYGVKVTATPAPSTPSITSKKIIKVEKANAVDIVKELPTLVRKCPVGVYTIVETKNGYGKLKSGEGWIKLSEVKNV